MREEGFTFALSEIEICKNVSGLQCRALYTLYSTVNGERFAGLNFCGFLAYHKSFPMNFVSNEHWWPMYRKSISAKNFIGLKP